ncbi:MAG: hypothetical protein K0Q78_2259 [Cellvibrio sp.]|nr:hypothetical protein [Cellvibrio sp.]
MHLLKFNPVLIMLPVIWMFLVAGANAQAPVTPIPPAATPHEKTVAPIDMQDILNDTYAEQKRLELAKKLLSAPDPVIQLRKKLDDIAAQVDTQLSATSKFALRELPIMRLESLSRHLKFDTRLLDRWEVEANYLLAPYSDSALRLAQDRLSWSATRAAGLINALPREVSTHVETMLTQFDVTEAALAAALAEQFELRQRASEIRAQIQTGSNAVDAAINDIDRRLFRVDAPPVWQGLGPSVDTGAAFATMRSGLEIEKQFALDYEAAGTGNHRARRMVQILLIPLIFWLALRSRQQQGEAGAAVRHNHGLSRPVSTWLLLSMLFLLLLEPDAPILVQEIALLLGLIPVLRLLPLGTLRAWGIWPYLAVALYLLDRTGLIFVTDPNYHRQFLLVLNGLALGLMVALLRRFTLAELPQPGRQSVGAGVRLTCRILLVVLLIAVGCNIVGNVSLAERLTSGIIDSTYMGLLLYLGVSACFTILQTLLDQKELAQFKLLQRYRSGLELLFKRLLVLGAVIVWLVYSMERLRILRPLQEAATKLLAFGIEVGEVSIHISDVLVFLFSVWLAVWVAKAVRKLLMDELPGHTNLPRGVGNSIASLSYYGLLLLGLLVALSAAGFKVSQLTLVFGALGVGIGFGLQNVVNNFVSGMVLMFERPIQPGDIIDTAGISGTVREIGLRATILRTFDGADVVVPNGSLLSSNLTNWTMFDHARRIEVPVGVAYGSDPAQVLELLNKVARSTPGVSAYPEPVVLMTGYGESALNFVARVWTNDINFWMNVRGELLARMLASLKEAGISIPYPQVDFNLRAVPEPLTTAMRATEAGEQKSETDPLSDSGTKN